MDDTHPQPVTHNLYSHWALTTPLLTSARSRNYEVRLKEDDSTFVPNVGNLCPRPKKWKAADYENYGTQSVDDVADGTYLSGRGYN